MTELHAFEYRKNRELIVRRRDLAYRRLIELEGRPYRSPEQEELYDRLLVLYDSLGSLLRECQIREDRDGIAMLEEAAWSIAQESCAWAERRNSMAGSHA